MTRNERDSIMKYVGMIRGICSTFDMGGVEYECDEDRAYMNSLQERLIDIAMDLECVAKGVDNDIHFRELIKDEDPPAAPT